MSDRTLDLEARADRLEAIGAMYAGRAAYLDGHGRHLEAAPLHARALRATAAELKCLDAASKARRVAA